MLTKAFNKKLSAQEQENLILNKFKDFEIKDIYLETLNLKVFSKKRFFFKKLEKNEFLYLESFLNKLNTVVSLEATVFNDFININLKEAKKFMFLNNTFFNPIENTSINIEFKKILINKKNNLMLDTSLFNVFYINKKTANHFSKIYLIDKLNIYLYKRKESYYLFGLNL